MCYSEFQAFMQTNHVILEISSLPQRRLPFAMKSTQSLLLVNLELYLLTMVTTVTF